MNSPYFPTCVGVWVPLVTYAVRKPTCQCEKASSRQALTYLTSRDGTISDGMRQEQRHLSPSSGAASWQVARLITLIVRCCPALKCHWNRNGSIQRCGVICGAGEPSAPEGLARSEGQWQSAWTARTISVQKVCNGKSNNAPRMPTT